MADMNNLIKLDTNACSKECCAHSQWKVPKEVKPYNVPEGMVGSNLSCNYGEGGGCLCVSKNDIQYLANRGGNN